jgi:hypothetical protein
MTELQASRTLVKSPPELWAECSDAASLARHLGQFGEIRITRLDPETAVAWEGEHARGTVRIEPSGWGTKVILTAVAVSAEAAPAVADEPVAPEEPVEALDEPVEALDEPVEALHELADPTEVPAESAQPTEPPRRRRFAWLFARRRAPDLTPEPGKPPHAAVAEPPPEPKATQPGAPLDPEANQPEANQPEANQPEADQPEATAPEPEVSEPEPATAVSATEAALTAALDSLGQAHHRPYSRA